VELLPQGTSFGACPPATARLDGKVMSGRGRQGATRKLSVAVSQIARLAPRSMVELHVGACLALAPDLEPAGDASGEQCPAGGEERRWASGSRTANCRYRSRRIAARGCRDWSV
jgi:hypothetical protein